MPIKNSKRKFKALSSGNVVILTGRLGTKLLVVNTKWPWHLSILPWLPESPFTVHTCMCAESCPKSASTNLSRGVYMIKPASRKTMADGHARHR